MRCQLSNLSLRELKQMTLSPMYVNHNITEDGRRLLFQMIRTSCNLCDDETIVYRPTTDKLETKRTIVESLGIHPTNMALARAMVGDTSDNLPGVNRVGFKTIAKNLQFMSEEREVTIDELMEYCENIDSKAKVFQNILDSRSVVEHNYKMMQLYSPLISIQGTQKIDYALENFECDFNKTELLRMMMEDGFGELNWEELKTFLNRISYECKDN